MSAKYLTLPVVAERLSTPLETVRYWVYQGRLPAIKPGRHPLVSEAALAAFIESSELGKVRTDRVRNARAASKRGAA